MVLNNGLIPERPRGFREEGFIFFESEKYFFKNRKVAKNISIILLENMKNILLKSLLQVSKRHFFVNP